MTPLRGPKGPLFHGGPRRHGGFPTLWRSPTLSRDDRMQLLLHQLLRQRDRAHGVFSVAVGADFIGPAAGYGCASDHDFYLRAETLFFEGFHDTLLISHRRGEKRGDADDVGLEFACF